MSYEVGGLRRWLIDGRIHLFIPALHLLTPATGGLGVGGIPNEITTCIITNSSKSSILAQAINIGSKKVKRMADNK